MALNHSTAPLQQNPGIFAARACVASIMINEG